MALMSQQRTTTGWLKGSTAPMSASVAIGHVVRVVVVHARTAWVSIVSALSYPIMKLLPTIAHSLAGLMVLMNSTLGRPQNTGSNATTQAPAYYPLENG